MKQSIRIAQLGLAVVLVAASAPVAANVTVILRSGGRIEATSAFETPKGWALNLPGGGSLTLTAESVRRVSDAAADLPRNRSLGLAASSPATAGPTSSGEAEQAQPSFPRFQAPSENLRVPRSASLLAQGAPGVAPRGIMPTAEQSASRQALQRAAGTNPLTGVIQRYSPNTAGSTDPGVRDPMATAGMHRAFGHPVR
jgi:hypothetical protein